MKIRGPSSRSEVLKHLLGDPALKGGPTTSVLQDADAESALQGLTRGGGR